MSAGDFHLPGSLGTSERYLPKVYVGCGLTHAPQPFIDLVSRLKQCLRDSGECIVLEFLGLEGGTARDVWDHDIRNCVGRCDLLVAILDYPSIGLGVEIGCQAARRKRVIGLVHQSTHLTRLMQDPNPEDIDYALYGYEHLDEMLEIVMREVRKLHHGGQMLSLNLEPPSLP